MDSKIAAGLLVGLLIAVPAGAQAPRDEPARDADKLESAAEQISRMKASMKQVLAQVEQARDEQDLVKLNCGYEKLTQMKVLVAVAEQADIALHGAVSNRDPAADTELAKIATVRSKVEGLRGEAEECTGQLAYVVEGRTEAAHLPGSRSGEARIGVALPGQGASAAVAKTSAELTAGSEGRPPGRGPPFPLPPPVRPPPASRFN